MLDLETLGTKPGCAILSIGAVRMRDFQIVDSFYQIIDTKSCQNHGLTIDAGTLKWWMSQSEEARQEAFSGESHVVDVLHNFAAWVTGCGWSPIPKRIIQNIFMWGNAPTFDCKILEHAYTQVIGDVYKPWNHFNERCYRTMKNVSPDQHLIPEREGIHHNALDDAKFQAQHLLNIFHHINQHP